MTSTVSEVTISAITSGSIEALSSTLGIITILLLIALLVLKEITRVFDSQQSEARMRALDIAILPLLLAFGYFVILRYINL